MDAARQVAARSDALIIQGPIDPALRDAVLKVLSAHNGPLKTVLLASAGGIEAVAESIGRALARAGVRRMVVPDGFICASACLEIAMLSGASFEPADGSRLMLHREWEAYGAQDCWLCLGLSEMANAAEDLIHGRDWHRHQQTWANALAPGLGDRLAACTPNPFDTSNGITFTGRAFKAFRSGDHSAVACPGKTANSTAPSPQ